MSKEALNIFNYMLSKFIPLLLNLAFIPILMRMMSVEDYGMYNMLFQLFTLCNTILLITTYYLQRHYLSNRSLLFDTIKANILISLIIFLFLPIILYVLFKNTLLIHCIIILLCLINYSIFQNLMTVLNVIEDTKEYRKYQNYYSVFRVIISILLLLVFNNYLVLFIAILVILVPINIKLLKFNMLFKERKLSFKSIKSCFKSYKLFPKYFRYGVPLILFSMFDVVMNYTDIFIGKFTVDLESIGYYSGIYNLLNYVILFPQTVIVLWIFPKILKLYEGNQFIKLKMMFLRTLFFYVILAGILSAILWIVGEFLFSYFLTPTYAVYFREFGLLIPALIMSGVLKLFVLILQIHLKNVKLMISTVVLISILNAVLTGILIRNLEMKGAALATLISYTLSIAIFGLLVKRVFQSFKFEKIKK